MATKKAGIKAGLKIGKLGTKAGLGVVKLGLSAVPGGAEGVEVAETVIDVAEHVAEETGIVGKHIDQSNTIDC